MMITIKNKITVALLSSGFAMQPTINGIPQRGDLIEAPRSLYWAARAQGLGMGLLGLGASIGCRELSNRTAAFFSPHLTKLLLPLFLRYTMDPTSELSLQISLKRICYLTSAFTLASSIGTSSLVRRGLKYMSDCALKNVPPIWSRLSDMPSNTDLRAEDRAIKEQIVANIKEFSEIIGRISREDLIKMSPSFATFAKLKRPGKALLGMYNAWNDASTFVEFAVKFGMLDERPVIHVTAEGGMERVRTYTIDSIKYQAEIVYLVVFIALTGIAIVRSQRSKV